MVSWVWPCGRFQGFQDDQEPAFGEGMWPHPKIMWVNDADTLREL